MDLRNLKTFDVVATYLNFTKAAEALNYSQPTVSQQIKMLEEDLGQTLIQRTGKQMLLTPAGQLLKERTTSLFQYIAEIEKDLETFKQPVQKLTIAAPEFYCSYYLSIIISAFLAQYPTVQVKLICANSEDTLRLVKEEQADFGFVALDDFSSTIQSTLLGAEDLVFVAHPALVKARPIHDLNDEPFITYSRDFLIQRCLEEVNYYPKKLIEFGSEEAIKGAVLKKSGVALLSDFLLKDEIIEKQLVVLHRFKEKLPTYAIQLQYRENDELLRAFLQTTEQIWKSVK